MILWIKIFLEWLIFLINFVFIWRQNIDIVERMIGMIMANLGHTSQSPLILFFSTLFGSGNDNANLMAVIMEMKVNVKYILVSWPDCSKLQGTTERSKSNKNIFISIQVLCWHLWWLYSVGCDNDIEDDLCWWSLLLIFGFLWWSSQHPNNRGQCTRITLLRCLEARTRRTFLVTNTSRDSSTIKQQSLGSRFIF